MKFSNLGIAKIEKAKLNNLPDDQFKELVDYICDKLTHQVEMDSSHLAAIIYYVSGYCARSICRSIELVYRTTNATGLILLGN